MDSDVDKSRSPGVYVPPLVGSYLCNITGIRMYLEFPTKLMLISESVTRDIIMGPAIHYTFFMTVSTLTTPFRKDHYLQSPMQMYIKLNMDCVQSILEETCNLAIGMYRLSLMHFVTLGRFMIVIAVLLTVVVLKSEK